MALKTLKIIERELEYSAVEKCPRKWERPEFNLYLDRLKLYGEEEFIKTLTGFGRDGRI